MTPDIERLRTLSPLPAPLDRLGLQLVNDPAWAEPSDTSYLRPEELANPDIAANVQAMAATNALISWFGRDEEGFLGLWRGPDALAISMHDFARPNDHRDALYQRAKSTSAIEPPTKKKRSTKKKPSAKKKR